MRAREKSSTSEPESRRGGDRRDSASPPHSDVRASLEILGE